MKDRNGVDWGWRGGLEELGEVERMGTMIRIHNARTKFIFN